MRQITAYRLSRATGHAPSTFTRILNGESDMFTILPSTGVRYDARGRPTFQIGTILYPRGGSGTAWEVTADGAAALEPVRRADGVVTGWRHAKAARDAQTAKDAAERQAQRSTARAARRAAAKAAAK